jgi:hypothetical protein
VLETSHTLDTTPTMSETRGLRRKELVSHLDENTAYHLELVYEEVNKRLERLEQETERESQCQSQQSRTSPSTASLSSASGGGPRLGRLVSQVSCKSTDDCGYSGSASGSGLLETGGLIRMEARMAEERARSDLLEAGQGQLVEDLTRLVRANELLREEVSRASEAVAEYRTVCGDLQRALAMTQVSLLAAEERLAHLQAASYDGKSAVFVRSLCQHSASSLSFVVDRNSFVEGEQRSRALG